MRENTVGHDIFLMGSGISMGGRQGFLRASDAVSTEQAQAVAALRSAGLGISGPRDRVICAQLACAIHKSVVLLGLAYDLLQQASTRISDGLGAMSDAQQARYSDSLAQIAAAGAHAEILCEASGRQWQALPQDSDEMVERLRAMGLLGETAEHTLLAANAGMALKEYHDTLRNQGALLESLMLQSDVEDWGWYEDEEMELWLEAAQALWQHLDTLSHAPAISESEPVCRTGESASMNLGGFALFTAAAGGHVH